MDKLVKTRLLGLIGVIVLFLGLLFPYIKVSFLGLSQGASLIQSWQGVVILLLLVVALAFIYRDYLKKMIPALFKTSFGKWLDKADIKFSLVPTGLIALFLLIFLLRGSNLGSYASLGVHYGLGFYLSWIGLICLIAFPFVYKEKKSKK